MSDTASNYVPFTVPSGSVIQSPIIKDDDGNVCWNLVGAVWQFGVLAGPNSNVEHAKFFLTADGSFIVACQDGPAWTWTRDTMNMPAEAVIKIDGVQQVLGPQQPAIDDNDGTLAGVAAQSQAILAALRANGLIHTA